EDDVAGRAAGDGVVAVAAIDPALQRADHLDVVGAGQAVDLDDRGVVNGRVAGQRDVGDHAVDLHLDGGGAGAGGGDGVVVVGADDVDGVGRGVVDRSRAADGAEGVDGPRGEVDAEGNAVAGAGPGTAGAVGRAPPVEGRLDRGERRRVGVDDALTVA